MKKLFIVVNDDWFFLSHRKSIAIEAQNHGYDVTIVAKNNGYRDEIIGLGAKFINLRIDNVGVNPWYEIKTLIFLIKLYHFERPTIVHHVGLKIILWGSLAAIFHNKISVVNAVSGLGVVFADPNRKLLSSMLLNIIRLAHKQKRIHIIFQNTEDSLLFLKNKIIKHNQYTIIKGSGIDLDYFSYHSEHESQVIKIVITARLIIEKGILDLVSAANILKDQYEDKIQFLICGGEHVNPNSLSIEKIQSVCDDQYIKYMGHVVNVRKLLISSHIVTLPSYYREGLPKSLLEASAIGRPIITTNSIGCKDTVIEGFNGFRIPIKSPIDLADKIKILVEDRDLRVQMGKNSRILAEREFSIKSVENKHLKIYNLLSHNIN